MRTKLVCLIIIVFVLSLTGALEINAAKESAEEFESAEKGDLIIGISMWNTTGPSAQQVIGLINKAVKVSGVKVVPWVDNYNTDDQIRAIENFVAMGVDGMMVCNTSDEVMVKMRDAADKLKTPFAQMFRTIADTETKEYVFASTYAIGNAHEDEYNTAYLIGKKLGELGYKNVAITTGPHGDFTAESRYAGLVAGLDEAGVNIVAEQWEVTTGEAAANAAQNFMQLYPELEVICMMYSVEGIIGVRNAIANAGKQGKIKIAAQDFTGIPEVDMELFANGEAVVLAGGHLVDPFFSYIMVANAVMGTPLSNKAEEVIVKHILLTNAEDAEFYFTNMEKGGELQAYNEEEIKMMFKKFNPDFTIEDLKKIAQSWSIEDWKQRRGL
jgi:ribose transport system substrate-binding protein